MNDFHTRSENGDREAAPQDANADTTTAKTSAGSPVGFRATWAQAANKAQIGKIQTLSGKKWPPTPGAKSKSYVFETREYASIVEFYVDYRSRQKNGIWTLIAGELHPDLDPMKPHQRVGANFIDVASTKFTLDFDGLEPDDADTPIDGADAYTGDNCEGKAVSVALARLPKAFGPASCMVSATSSTGLKIVSTGKPSEGKARFRATWEMTRARTCKQKGIITKAIAARPGLGGVKNDLCALAGFEFVPRPVFLPGETDPIKHPVYLLEGGLLDIDAVCAELGIDLDAGDDGQPRTGGASAGQGGPQTAKEGLALDLPAEQAEPLLRALLTAIGNGLGLRDDYNGWFGGVSAIFGASRGAAWGLDIAAEWTESGGYDAKEVYDKWAALTASGDGRNGIDYLIKLAMALAKEKSAEAEAADKAKAKAKADAARAKAAELEEAVSAIDWARAAKTEFPDDVDTLGLGEETAEPGHAEKKTGQTAWDHLKKALRWPGMEEALEGNSNIARDEFGSAMIGKGASSAPPMARQWITDRHVRGRVSMLSGMPESGKTILDVGYAHAIATERPSLVGLSEIDRYGAVAIIALDNERADEFDLKGQAFRKHHNLQPGDFKHEIYIIEDCGPLVERQPGGDLGPSRGIIAVAKRLAAYRERDNLALVIVDTMLGAAGGADTSDGPAMSVIMQVVRVIAETLNCSADPINHLTKGGAARDPDSMDAALGARSASATPRFMTHLKKEGGFVRVTQAKRSYMGPTGCPLYEFQSVNIASTRPEDPTRTVIENVGVLVPAAKAAMAEVFAAEEAHQTLWAAHNQGVKIKRGSKKTVRGKDHASAIIEDAGVVNTAPPASRRAKAERLAAVLIKKGRLKVVKEWVGRHQVEIVVPEEPEELV